MIKKRLITLAKHLEKVASTLPGKRKRRFNMYTWVHRQPCGTAACAMGEACFIPEFKKLGLTLTNHTLPTYKGQTGWEACYAFFDLPADDALRVFSPASYYPDYIDPASVAQRIRSLVKGE